MKVFIMQIFSYYFNIKTVILPKFFHDDFSQHENGLKMLIFIFWSLIFSCICYNTKPEETFSGINVQCEQVVQGISVEFATVLV